MDRAAERVINQARAALTSEVVAKVESVTRDSLVFPAQLELCQPGGEWTYFPGWHGTVLLLGHENQSVCAWGVALDGQHAGQIVVGGGLAFGEGTIVFCADIDEFVEAFAFDSHVLAESMLLQAQAAQLDEGAIDWLQRRFDQRVTTEGWPGLRSLRWKAEQVQLLLWDGQGQCDWFISGNADRLDDLMPELLQVSNLSASLWSNDQEGSDFLARHGF